MADSSEEKTLPPSKKKLDDARKKGQVPHSKDLVGAATLAASAGATWAVLGGLGAAAGAMLDAAGNTAGLGLGLGLQAIGAAVGNAVRGTVVPVFGLTVAAAVLGNLVVLRGVLFATDPIVPKLSNISPAKGFGKIFGVKPLVELVKNIVKVIALGSILFLTLWGGLRALAIAPSCGVGCVLAATRVVAMAMLGAAVAVFLVVALLDVLLQRWMFTRDQKMGVSEQKREHKEQEGDPHIKGARKRLMREAAQSTTRLGIKEASMIVHDGRGGAVGLRFVAGETPVPVVVCRGTGARGLQLLAGAQARGLPVSHHSELAATLLKGVAPGAYIPEKTYQAAALVLSQHGLV